MIAMTVKITKTKCMLVGVEDTGCVREEDCEVISIMEERTRRATKSSSASTNAQTVGNASRHTQD